MKAYLDILDKVLTEGTWKDSRTGIRCLSTNGVMFKHDLRCGFPLLTTKKMGLKNICTELEFFIKGIRDKKWLQDRACHIWDEWANPIKAPYGHDDESKKAMKEQRDLGRIYGVQWRGWATSRSYSGVIYQKIDQLRKLIETLKTNPTDRRMIVSAWNPGELDEMALPPCHYSFQVTSDGTYVDLAWNQRSVDTPIGLPYNIGMYAMLLMLIAKTANMVPRNLIGFLMDTHIYETQLSSVKEYMRRTPHILPEVILPEDTNIFTWTREDFELRNYKFHPKMCFGPIAI